MGKNESKGNNKPVKLHQILAIANGVNSRAESTSTRIHHINKKPALFSGFRKEWKPINEDGPQYQPERKLVQARVPDQIAQFSEALGEQFNVWWQRDKANQEAVADVVVDGKTIIEGAPVSFLLALEKRFQNIRTFIAELPTRDTADDWKAADAGIFRTPEPEQTMKTQKVQEALVVFPPSEHNKGGTHEMITKDVLIGHWQTIKESGGISEDGKRIFISRIEAISDAVKLAREEANSIEVPQKPSVGEDIFGFIFG